jgi:hypothetical protein
LEITGFYPDEMRDDSLQFELDIEGSEFNETVAQLIESDLEPGELKLSQKQVIALKQLLRVDFPDGLEYFIGTRAVP